MEVALLGDARVEQTAAGATRSGERMLVTAEVAGHVQLTTDENNARDDHDTPDYREADAMRAAPAPTTTTSAPVVSATEPVPPAVAVAPVPPDVAVAPVSPVMPGGGEPSATPHPTTGPATRPAPRRCRWHSRPARFRRSMPGTER